VFTGRDVAFEKSYALDETDRAILRELTRDARLSQRQLGARVHLSAPAVGERMRRLEDAGVITGYHAHVDVRRLSTVVNAFVNVIMRSAEHERFLRFAAESPAIRELHRLSGDSCYLLRVELPDHAALEVFLERILEHGNYRLNIALSSIRKSDADAIGPPSDRPRPNAVIQRTERALSCA
jgi:Lrp/AsnC family transcriptional regulator, leucine-responsive regulatory protein